MPPKVGARGLMVIPRVLSRGSSSAAQMRPLQGDPVEAADDTARGDLQQPLLRLCNARRPLLRAAKQDHPNLVGFKEFGGKDDLRYAAENITSRDAGVTLMVGVDTAVYHGYVNCGGDRCDHRHRKCTAQGSPPLLIELSQKAATGDVEARRLAKELTEALAVLTEFDDSPELVVYYKRLMVLEGNDEYTHHINATDKLSPSQQAHLDAQWKLFKAWWNNWPGAN
jgi:dihydrodipicolinate synthase/N-acetylneuraminate lyase